ncbi:hypothetical protein [Zavarzinella formosa]|uniref:hypothetical protein n=1 Tax=Zavarzinella formosa TaxID=360055 RepID=UPI0002E6A8E2|nr:hypothetical protein [Zavarzinella formosa]
MAEAAVLKRTARSLLQRLKSLSLGPLDAFYQHCKFAKPMGKFTFITHLLETMMVAKSLNIGKLTETNACLVCGSAGWVNAGFFRCSRCGFQLCLSCEGREAERDMTGEELDESEKPQMTCDTFPSSVMMDE